MEIEKSRLTSKYVWWRFGARADVSPASPVRLWRMCGWTGRRFTSWSLLMLYTALSSWNNYQLEFNLLVLYQSINVTMILRVHFRQPSWASLGPRRWTKTRVRWLFSLRDQLKLNPSDWEPSSELSSLSLPLRNCSHRTRTKTETGPSLGDGFQDGRIRGDWGSL